MWVQCMTVRFFLQIEDWTSFNKQLIIGGRSEDKEAVGLGWSCIVLKLY